MGQLPVPERRALVARLASDLPAEKIAGALGVSRRTVARDLAAEGVTSHPRGRPRRRIEPESVVGGERRTDADRLARLTRAYEQTQRQIEERLARGEQVVPSELESLLRVEQRLQSYEESLSLRELTVGDA